MQRMWKLPAFTPDAEAVATYQRDGVAVLRGVIPNRTLLAALAESMYAHTPAHQHREYWGSTWFYDGGTRALATSGADLARAVALVELGAGAGKDGYLRNMRASIAEAPIWGYPAQSSSSGESPNKWHSDMDPAEAWRHHLRGITGVGIANGMNDQGVHTMWLAISDAGRPLELIAGTQSVEERVAAHLECNMSHVSREFSRVLDDSCMQRRMRRKGQRSTRPTLVAGDAIIFNGHTVHRGWLQTFRRIGISIRFVYGPSPAMRGAGEVGHMRSAMHPQAHPLTPAVRSVWMQMPWVEWSKAKTQCAAAMLADACESGEPLVFSALCDCSICGAAWGGSHLHSNTTRVSNVCSAANVVDQLLPKDITDEKLRG